MDQFNTPMSLLIVLFPFWIFLKKARQDIRNLWCPTHVVDTNEACFAGVEVLLTPVRNPSSMSTTPLSDVDHVFD
jgi:hypothetical protein